MAHSWQKIGYNKAKCKNCPWHRQTEKFDGEFITVYVNPVSGARVYHAPDCGTPPPKENDEIYSVKDVAGEQLNFAHLLKMEAVLLTGQLLKSRRNSFVKRR